MQTHQFFTWTTHTAEITTLLEATRLQKLYTYMCNIVTEFYLYSIVYIYLINSRLDVTHSVCHHFRTIQTLLEATRLQKLYTYMCNIVTEFYLYSIVYIYLINSRLDVTHSVRHHFRTTQTLSFILVKVLCYHEHWRTVVGISTNRIAS